MTAVSLPDQIPPQGAPFVYQDDTGNWRMEVDWYLFFYAMWGQLVGQTGGVAFMPGINVPMIDLESVGADSAQAARQLTNAALLQPDLPDAGPTLRDLTNALVLALDALQPDPPSIIVQELDGLPSGQVATLVLPNNTLAIAGNTATYTPTPASGASLASAGRLTLTAGVPVTTTDVTGATSVWLEPYKGNQLQAWDGSQWTTYTFPSTQLAIGTKTAGLPYDVFVRQVAGVLTLDDLAWASTTARATAITLQDGRYCKSGDKTRLYLGTYYTTSTTTTEDSGGGTTTNVGGKRFLWNMYNREPRWASVIEATASWTYTILTWRQARATAGNKIEFVIGDPTQLEAHALSAFSNTSNCSGGSGIGINSTSTNSALLFGQTAFAGAGLIMQAPSRYLGLLPVGYSAINWLEQAQVAGTMTWYGQPNTAFQTGMHGWVMG